MKRNMVPLLGIAFVVAIISTGVFYGLFAGKLRSSSAELSGHPIVVAARELDRGKVVQAADLRVSQVRGRLSGSFSKPEEVLGATLVLPVKETSRFSRIAWCRACQGREIPEEACRRGCAGLDSGGRVGWSGESAASRIEDRHSGGIGEDRRDGAADHPAERGSIGGDSAERSEPGRGAGDGRAHRAHDADAVALADSGARIRVRSQSFGRGGFSALSHDASGGVPARRRACRAG